MCAGFVLISFMLGLIVLDNRVTLFVTTIVQMYALALTGTRMAWIAIAISFAVGLFIYIRDRGWSRFMAMNKRRRLYATALVGVVILVFAMTLLLSPAGKMIIERTINNPISKDSSANYRVFVFGILLRVFSGNTMLQKVLGSGYSSGNQALWNDEEYLNSHSKNAWPVDNGYLSVLYDFGILGIIIVILIALAAIRIVLDKKSERHDIIISLLLLLLGVTMASYDMLYFTNISYIVFIFVGMVLGIYDKNYRSNILNG